MKGSAVLATAILVLVMTEGTAEAKVAPTPSLVTTVNVQWTGEKLSKALEELVGAAGVKVVLDPTLPKEVLDTPVRYAASRVSVKGALGAVLRCASLRYVIMEGGGVFVSTREGAARAILSGKTETPAFVEAEPMGLGEALATLGGDLDDDSHLVGDPRVTIYNKPWKQPKKESVNPATGLTDYPGPPIWIDSPDADSPRFKYTSKPSFLKPEYKSGVADSDEEELTELLGKLAAILQRHPGWRNRVVSAASED